MGSCSDEREISWDQFLFLYCSHLMWKKICHEHVYDSKRLSTDLALQLMNIDGENFKNSEVRVLEMEIEHLESSSTKTKNFELLMFCNPEGQVNLPHCPILTILFLLIINIDDLRAPLH